MRECNYVIIGGGCSGMAAAVRLWEIGERDVLLMEREASLGGVLNQCLHKGFGLEYFGENLTGVEFAARLMKKLRDTGVRVMTGTAVTEISPEREVFYTNAEECGVVRAKVIILASGCRERTIDGTEVIGTRPSGIFTAGQAQKMVNVKGYDIGENFVILGSGDVGMIVARDLKSRGKNVAAVLEREAVCGGLERNRKECLELYGITLKTRCTVKAVLGSPRITGVETEDLITGEREVIPCDTLIVSTGLIPERELMEIACRGGICPDWFFVAGNCDFVHDTADMASKDGERTAQAAAKYLKTGEHDLNMGRERRTDAILNPGETLCLNCPRECVLYAENGMVFGNACEHYDRSILEVKSERE